MPMRVSKGVFDVVVVGAGGCGLTAALAAAVRGADVSWYAKRLLGLAANTALSGGILAAGTRFISGLLAPSKIRRNFSPRTSSVSNSAKWH